MPCQRYDGKGHFATGKQATAASFDAQIKSTKVGTTKAGGGSFLHFCPSVSQNHKHRVISGIHSKKNTKVCSFFLFHSMFPRCDRIWSP
jgi:hypothetical protein